MYRRRRARSTEVVFSFDSFLDLVANVVGIIIRLILVAWVGAKTYTGVFKPPPDDAATSETRAAVAPPLPGHDAEKAALEAARRRLADARKALLERLHQQGEELKRRADLGHELLERTEQSDGLKAKADAADRRRQELLKAGESVTLSLVGLQQRSEQLEKELARLEKEPRKTNVLRYQTPVSRTVQSEELAFECKGGHVTFIDVNALTREIKDNLRAKGELLKDRWEVEAETSQVGAFRLRYVVAREKSLIDDVTGARDPDDRSDFRFGVPRWEVIPVSSPRGETVEQALKEKSDFRRIIDRLDPTRTAVTFWVYPDSFAMYRQLRDYCMKRDTLVAGRPLPVNVHIGSSREGTASRGQ
jgi:hypothetical protein